MIFDIITTVLKWTAAYFILRFIYIYFVKTFFLARFYRKQGLDCEYRPIFGFNTEIKKVMKERGDFCWRIKNVVLQRPKPKMSGCTMVDTVQLGVLDPKCIKEMLQKHENYKKYPLLISIQKLLLGEGLLLSEEQMWKKHRKYSSMAFHYDVIKQMLPDMQEIAEEFFNKMQPHELEKVNMIQEIQKITAEVVGRLFFGKRFSDYQIDGIPVAVFLEKLSSDSQHLAIQPICLLFGPSIVKLRLLKNHRELLDNIQKFRQFSLNIIRDIIKELSEKKSDKTSEKGTKSMIEIFYSQTQENPDDPLTEEEIISLFISFFAAGMDTTGHLIGMASYHLLMNPQYKPKLMEEINKTLQEPANLTTEALNQMELMTAVLKESLRMAPPTPFIFPREALVDHELAGIQIKKGTILNPQFVANNFDPDYHEKPNTFYPERWITDSLTKNTITSDPWVFTPFSGGMRNCIGQHVAMLEARIILGTFLRKFNYELKDKSYEMKYAFRFLYEPHEPIYYSLTRV